MSNAHLPDAIQRALIGIAPPPVASSQMLVAENDEAEQTPEQIEARFRAVRESTRPDGLTAAMNARQAK